MAVIPRLRRRRRRDPAGNMTLIEHLGELRARLLVSVVAVLVGTIGGWFLFGPVFSVLKHPYCAALKAHPTLNPFAGGRCVLAFQGVTEPFLLKLKIATFTGFVFALPVVLYEVWRFITPGLTSRERKFALPFVLSSLVLFAMGTWFAFFTLPKGLNFLLGFAGTRDVVSLLTITKYVNFVVFLIIAFGVSFEFPLLLISLTAVGVLSSAKLREWRRYAIVGIAIFAAVITPSQDWFTMSAMMLPLIVFYELSILVSRLLLKR